MTRTQRRHGRRGYVFSVRLTDEERAELELIRAESPGPRAFGAWLLWAARRSSWKARRDVRFSASPLRAACPVCGNMVTLATPVLPEQLAAQLVLPSPAMGGTTDPESAVLPDQVHGVLPARARGTTRSSSDAAHKGLILDLCGGSGSWSKPYRDAGYRVRLVTLPEHDVRTYVPPSEPVHGILAAPPCTEFSLAKNGQRRDFRRGLEVVSACLRIIAVCRPAWWALENPVGKLSTWLGTPRDVFEPADFGDPWTKRTAIWGDFTIPERGPFVDPLGGGPFCRVCDPEGKRLSWCRKSDHRAVTPPGFARAFFEANP